ncbi:hypothetical protein K458DRAFT_441540 [Lentithecium fluviatile CBS 122367]|uniref:Uncharacterized protein n=1 Tax=Lentithecium fluviatile CBS 122367 TaxID=1168545 RepID=A0A6G1J8H8_9PLEO|nr:hypothetical protein K458DRAFT_441540 [Lentithecium fluviatile CBS 122367]
MATQYILPHLRQKQITAPKESASTSRGDEHKTNFLKYNEIFTYFWGKSPGEAKHNTTLHSSAENPYGLACVLLFQGANPRFGTGGIVLVKSNLDLLPAIKISSAACKDDKSDCEDENGPIESSDLPKEGTPQADTSPSPAEGLAVDHSPFTVFTQIHRSELGRCFKFIGWYKVSRLELLAPRTEGLVRMLNANWTIGKAWEESLLHQWAVVKLEKDDQAMKEKSEPKIERIEDDEEGGKNFNELLTEMRLKDGST